MMVWEQPFSPVANPPASRKQALKAARQRREAGKQSSPPPEIANLTISTPQPVEIRPQLVDHYIMNLPDSALTFLDAFRGLLTPVRKAGGVEFEEKIKGLEGGGRPMIHVYCFTKKAEGDEASRDICEVSLSSPSYPRPKAVIRRK
jgi:tRNA (guanine37-N1)-methyltransferase